MSNNKISTKAQLKKNTILKKLANFRINNAESYENGFCKNEEFQFHIQDHFRVTNKVAYEIFCNADYINDNKQGYEHYLSCQIESVMGADWLGYSQLD